MGTLHSENVKIFCVMINIYTCSAHLYRPAILGLEKKSRDFCRQTFLLFTDFWWKIGHMGSRLRKPLKRGVGGKKVKNHCAKTSQTITTQTLCIGIISFLLSVQIIFLPFQIIIQI